jgi:hypothetical protein
MLCARINVRDIQTGVMRDKTPFKIIRGPVLDMLAMNKRVGKLAILSIATLLALNTVADAYSRKVKNACSADYASLCSQYKQGSAQLRRCFESNRKVLSQECISALVDAGEVPARYLRR